MGFWKRWFGKKDETRVEEVLQSPPPKVSTISPTTREFLIEKCDLCGVTIGQEKRRKVGGKIFHKKCFKEQYNQLKSQGKAM